MKARPIPPPERVDTRNEEQKEADKSKLIANIQIMQSLMAMCSITGHDYLAAAKKIGRDL